LLVEAAGSDGFNRLRPAASSRSGPAFGKKPRSAVFHDGPARSNLRRGREKGPTPFGRRGTRARCKRFAPDGQLGRGFVAFDTRATEKQAREPGFVKGRWIDDGQTGAAKAADGFSDQGFTTGRRHARAPQRGAAGRDLPRARARDLSGRSHPATGKQKPCSCSDAKQKLEGGRESPRRGK